MCGTGQRLRAAYREPQTSKADSAARARSSPAEERAPERARGSESPLGQRIKACAIADRDGSAQAHCAFAHHDASPAAARPLNQPLAVACTFL